ncbi:F0F1 ATP synthase subunit A [Dissulfurirhabdus thermomarina]|uniref:ATP synthase subunit a n=1 Tax=Dissulfurirhabdus thermomarina TaxID=1765737 RepID=A0A6N9TUA9_DISTH|nr:F0F1 ATP synthase subunit A [Dissulfurirhabdus thermomarina]NDY42086.1 F0F1 ATP synthase subunit A [Dissulfurirhabdus thermomarina]NMX22836.1 F0F1 ATP synthase subunit A [Dissulfurirhabdus thermomarina]
MEHPLLFLSLILDALGLPAHGGETTLAKALAPHMQYSFLAMFLCLVAAWLGTRRMEMIPRGMQNLMEAYVAWLEDFIDDQTHDRRKTLIIFPMIATFFLYILIGNYMGLIPGFMSPTANLNVTLGCTAISIAAYHLLGIRFHGIKYIKHFMGPIPWMAPMMFPIEIFSHIGRILSLSIRLFGNMVSKEILLGLLFMLAGPYLAPLPVMFLGVLVCLLQAFIFMMLSIVYAVEAMAEGH